MHTIKQMNSLPANERGATLVVALILLVLISLIGVATLKSATLVEKMSSNDYQKSITFQASESAVILTLQDTDLISEVIRTNTAQTRNNVDVDIDNTVANVVYTPVGFGAIEGASIGENGVSGQRIMITSTGQTDVGTSTAPSTSSTRTVHGIVQLVPGFGSD